MNISSAQSVAWDAVPGAESYSVELQTAAGAFLALFSTSATTLPATTLLANRAFGGYRFRVRAVEAAGPGDWSAPFDLTFVALPAPSNLRVV